jgi:murein DD-endopeptidase MepM/ murein hydrolase activator NlpD
MPRWAGVVTLVVSVWPAVSSAAPLPCSGGVDAPAEAIVIQEGDRPWRALRRAKFEPREIAQALSTLAKITHFDGLTPGSELYVRRDHKGRLASVELRQTAGLAQCAERVRGKYRPKTIELPPVMRSELVEGEWGGAPLEVSQLVSGIFGPERKGRYRALVETYFVENARVGYGRVLAASWIDPNGAASNAFAFTTESGELGYYTDQGVPIRTHGFAVPVPDAIMTSGFGLRRHPISRELKTHFGVDYAAPIGTPIYATQSGKIESAKREKHLGNAVIIDHGGGLVTRYGHMTSFARGIRKDRFVKKGALIGFVGKTGAATGPHLHLEAAVGGRPIDPRRLSSRVSPTLSERDKTRLLADVERVSRSLVPAYLADACSPESGTRCR